MTREGSAPIAGRVVRLKKTRSITDTAEFTFSNGHTAKVRDGTQVIPKKRNLAKLTLADFGGFEAYTYPYSSAPDLEPVVWLSATLDNFTACRNYKQMYRLAVRMRILPRLISNTRKILENGGLEALKEYEQRKRRRVRYRTFELEVIQAFIAGYEQDKPFKKPEIPILHKLLREEYLKRSLNQAHRGGRTRVSSEAVNRKSKRLYTEGKPIKESNSISKSERNSASNPKQKCSSLSGGVQRDLRRPAESR